MPYETILVTRGDHIATVTINRPHAKNSFTPANAGAVRSPVARAGRR